MMILGHPVHPMLVAFPIGFLIGAVGFDIVALATNDPSWFATSYWLIAAGIVTGLVAAVFGVLDWRGLPAGSRASRVGFVHGAGNVAVVALFAASWWLRGPSVVPAEAAILLSLAGVALLVVTGWLGGELVYRMGVGVDEDAHPNAPALIRDGSPARPARNVPGE